MTLPQDGEVNARLLEIRRRFFLRRAGDELASVFKVPTKNILPLPKGSENISGIDRTWFVREEDPNHTARVKASLETDPR